MLVRLCICLCLIWIFFSSSLTLCCFSPFFSISLSLSVSLCLSDSFSVSVSLSISLPLCLSGFLSLSHSVGFSLILSLVAQPLSPPGLTAAVSSKRSPGPAGFEEGCLPSSPEHTSCPLQPLSQRLWNRVQGGRLGREGPSPELQGLSSVVSLCVVMCVEGGQEALCLGEGESEGFAKVCALLAPAAGAGK